MNINHRLKISNQNSANVKSLGLFMHPHGLKTSPKVTVEFTISMSDFGHNIFERLNDQMNCSARVKLEILVKFLIYQLKIHDVIFFSTKKVHNDLL